MTHLVLIRLFLTHTIKIIKHYRYKIGRKRLYKKLAGTDLSPRRKFILWLYDYKYDNPFIHINYSTGWVYSNFKIQKGVYSIDNNSYSSGKILEDKVLQNLGIMTKDELTATFPPTRMMGESLDVWAETYHRRFNKAVMIKLFHKGYL